MNSPDAQTTNKEAEPLAHYYPGAPVVNESGWGTVPRTLRSLLDSKPDPSDIDWKGLQASTRNEGIINYIAYRAHQNDFSLPGEIQQAVRQSLLTGEADKLSGDFELSRIFSAADKAGLKLLLIKGEALARTVYPSGTCRPSGDFDLLMDPSQLDLGEQVMTGLDYSPGTFEGLHMFGQRTWNTRKQGRPFVVDLHWDLTNRRFFRNRVAFQALFDNASELALEKATIRIPTPRHSLLIACIHLAAAEPEMPVDLRWLLDIRLLLDELEEAEFKKLVDEARRFGVVDVLANYCGLADRILGPCLHRDQFLALADRIDPAKKRQYQRCCEQRWYDLFEYCRRLPGWKSRLALLGQAIPYVFRRLDGRDTGPD